MRLLLTVSTIALGVSLTERAGAQEAFSFVALGDMPYTLPDDYAKYERLIAATNDLGPLFTIHVGDTKGGSTSCADDILETMRDYFDTYDHPVIYTPGDNEWTDCHREAAGGMDPLERLEKVRELHFTEAKSLGQNPIDLERQSDVSDHTQMVENARWEAEGVQFATVHVVGSNNGFERNPDSVAEYFARDEANVEWILETAERAAENAAAGLVYAIHADMRFGTPDDYARANYGFWNTLDAFRSAASTFTGPILLIHGDYHVLEIDRPLADDEGNTFLNLTRLQVMGAGDVHAVEVMVDPSTPGVFGFRPLIVEENLELAQE